MTYPPGVQVRNLRESGLQLEAVDKFLKETAADEELETALEIACRCVSLMPFERPPMNRVVQYLEPLGDFEGTILLPLARTP